VHSNLGNILKDLGKLKEAELSYRKAIKINPDFADAHLNLGILLRNIGKIKELLLLSESTRESRSINKGYKLLASLQITIANLIQGDFAETLLNLNRTNQSIKRGNLNLIEENNNKKHTIIYSQFITSLYPLLEKENKNPDLEKIPHIGESHCLSFAHQTISLSSKVKTIQPVLITGGKAWHFANKKNNRWKDSLTQQIKNHKYSDEVFISFGEIDCRKDEGILTYSIKKNKDISEVCKRTIQGYLDYMEEILTPNYSTKYYFGVPAPTKGKELPDELDIKRIEMIKLYNSILKIEVLSRSSCFLDVYALTSNKDGENNNLYMCDQFHLSPQCLSILFEKYLYKREV
jgi:tetratricopeptide (TPR) repeat protein